MSLKDRLERKAVRTAVVQIPVGDPPADLRRRAWEEAEKAMIAGLSADLPENKLTPEMVESLTETAEVAVGELAEFFEPLELQAVPAAVWDDILTRHATDDGDVSEAALAEMVAVSCVDEDLRDPAWWAAQLKGPGWTYGDQLALRSAVLKLNQYEPLPQLGKGSRTTR